MKASEAFQKTLVNKHCHEEEEEETQQTNQGYRRGEVQRRVWL